MSDDVDLFDDLLGQVNDNDQFFKGGVATLADLMKTSTDRVIKPVEPAIVDDDNLFDDSLKHASDNNSNLFDDILSQVDELIPPHGDRIIKPVEHVRYDRDTKPTEHVRVDRVKELRPSSSSIDVLLTSKIKKETIMNDLEAIIGKKSKLQPLTDSLNKMKLRLEQKEEAKMKDEQDWKDDMRILNEKRIEEEKNPLNWSGGRLHKHLVGEFRDLGIPATSNYMGNLVKKFLISGRVITDKYLKHDIADSEGAFNTNYKVIHQILEQYKKLSDKEKILINNIKLPKSTK